MKHIDVLYQTTDGLEPTQGYDGDFCEDIYASEGRLIPPLTFQSVKIPTDFKTAFPADLYGLKMNLRSGVAAHTPVILSNGTAIIEGNFRGSMVILARNTFIDNRLVDFVFDVKGKRLPLSEVPEETLQNARAFFNAETELLGYDNLSEKLDQDLYRTLVPAGTVYVKKHERIAQIHFQEKIHPNFIKSDVLPDSGRGAGGLGSSGSHHKKGEQ